MKSALMSSLAEVNRLFADRPVGELDICTHCYSDEDEVALRGPVDSVPYSLVASVAAEGFDHWADPVGLYKRMTPRIIGLLMTDELHVDEALVASRFLQAGWSDWPVQERSAILEAGRQWWIEGLGTYPTGSSMTEKLEFLVPLSGDISPWLDLIGPAPAGPVDLHLRDLCQRWLPELFNGALELGWSGGYDIASDLIPWLVTHARPRLQRVADLASAELKGLDDLAARQ